MLAYVLFFGIMTAGTVLTLLGEVLAVVLGVGAGINLARRRPTWYVRKVVKGAAIGSVAGGLFALATFDGVFLLHFSAAGAGYVGLVLAKVYFPFRMEAAGPPL